MKKSNTGSLDSVALVGNPNCGKTTLFNALTGMNGYVGNRAGVTVEKKSALTRDGCFELVDLPGIYSLSPYSLEEITARNYLLKERPSAIINIIDGTSIERGLYLTLQLIELEIPMIIVINMMDEVRARGGSIDTIRLSQGLDLPVAAISARNGDNIDSILNAVKIVLEKGSPNQIRLESSIQNTLNKIYALIYNGRCGLPYSFCASKLLEKDKKIIADLCLSDEITLKVNEVINSFEQKTGDGEMCLIDARYRYVERLCRDVVHKGEGIQKSTLSEQIDNIVTNKYLALPILAAAMALIFFLTFGAIGSLPSNALESFIFGFFSDRLRLCLDWLAVPKWLESLVLDGILSGVGAVISFLPQIAILFLCLSLLEDLGYMARAAFITDKFLQKLGLSGKCFIPMIMGLGCSTPAIMATRTQENICQRKECALLIPFVSCSAKLPIYSLFAKAFFPKHQELVILSMYAIGFALAIVIGLALKKTVFAQSNAAFIMELPAYRLPKISSVLKSTLDRCRGFIVKAGTLIFLMSIAIWFLRSFTPSLSIATAPNESIFSLLGTALAPLFAPLGFGDSKSSIALLSGLVAKEAVVSTMSVLYGASDVALSGAIVSSYTPLSAYCFMLFCLLYSPCISALATIRKELGLRWSLASAVLSFSTAYLVTFAVYQIGSLL